MKLIFAIFLLISVLVFNGVSSFGSHHGGHRNKIYHVTKSQVTMPSGKKFFIVNPHLKGKCKPDLITLSETNRRWKNEYNIVKKELENTKGVSLGAFTGYKNIKIEKVINPCLWSRYQYRKHQVVRDATTANERMLFHASSASHTLTRKGFDERYAPLSGTYGAGLYFSDNSFKTHSYTKPKPDGTRIMMLCRVSLGEIHNVTGPTNLAHPPVGFQSVSGGDNTFTEFIIYRGEQAYPEYLITYKST